MVNFSHTDPGTPEAMWVEAGVGELPPLPAEAEPGRAPMVLILSAHPDDETLGAGGLVRLALAAGARVHVIVATAGEASHPGSPGHPPERLARIRAAELEEALAALGPA
ncbi:MAG: PIG-L family deacetylase, partial [Paeniglutamicibacter sp.]